MPHQLHPNNQIGLLTKPIDSVLFVTRMPMPIRCWSLMQLQHPLLCCQGLLFYQCPKKKKINSQQSQVPRWFWLWNNEWWIKVDWIIWRLYERRRKDPLLVFTLTGDIKCLKQQNNKITEIWWAIQILQCVYWFHWTPLLKTEYNGGVGMNDQQSLRCHIMNTHWVFLNASGDWMS